MRSRGALFRRDREGTVALNRAAATSGVLINGNVRRCPGRPIECIPSLLKQSDARRIAILLLGVDTYSSCLHEPACKCVADQPQICAVPHSQRVTFQETLLSWILAHQCSFDI